MDRGARKDRGIGRAKELYEFPAVCSKLRQKIRQPTSVVVCLVRASVGQIGRCQLRLTREDLLGAAQPERLEIHEVTDILLRRPAALVNADEAFRGQLAGSFLQSCRTPAQPLEQAGEARHRQGEIKGTFEPLFAHMKKVVRGPRESWDEWRGGWDVRCDVFVRGRGERTLGA
jgi:hypothetical protein